MRRLLLAASAIALLGTSAAWAQEQPIAPGPPIPGAPVTSAQEPVTAPGPAGLPPGAAQAPTMYAAKSANIRAGAGKAYSVIGKLHVNDAVQIVGPVPGNPSWYQLASGGFVSATTLSPTPVAIVRRAPVVVQNVPPPSAAYYPVGACEPYSRVVNIGGNPHQLDGTACKQPDGTWRIQNYGVPTPVVAPAPVYVAPAPLVYGPPPPPPVYYEHRHDPYWRY